MRPLVEEKENSEFKPVKDRSKIDVVSYPARVEGLVNMYIYLYVYGYDYMPMALHSDLYMLYTFKLRSVSPHLLTSLQFRYPLYCISPLHFVWIFNFIVSPLVDRLDALMFSSYSHPFSTSLMRNNNATIILCAYLLFIYWRLFFSLPVHSKQEVKDKSENKDVTSSFWSSISNWITNSESKTASVTWVKSSNKNHRLRLTSISLVVHLTHWLLNFP